MLPCKYTSTEGGSWQNWNYGNVEPSDLKKRSAGNVMIRGVRVHSLFFGEDAEHPRWDCINGFSSKGML